MGVCILKQGNYLIAAFQSALADHELLQLRDDLAEHAGKHRSQGAIIDVTMLDVVDSFTARTLRTMAQILRMRGAETVIAGIQPDVAFSMVQLGLTLGDVETALDLDEALALLDSRTKRGEPCDAAA